QPRAAGENSPHRPVGERSWCTAPDLANHAVRASSTRCELQRSSEVAYFNAGWRCRALVGAMHMLAAFRCGAVSHHLARQPLENAAVGGRVGLAALLAQHLQLLLQGAQLADTLCHMADIPIQQLVDPRAVLLRRSLEAQERANLVERHSKRAAGA